MVEKIEQAMRELDELDLEQLTHFADVLARNAAWQNLHPIKPAAMKWVGCLKGGPYKNGLEAQEAAKHYRMFLLERSMPR